MIAKHQGRKGREFRDHPRISASIFNKKFVTFSVSCIQVRLRMCTLAFGFIEAYANLTEQSLVCVSVLSIPSILPGCESFWETLYEIVTVAMALCIFRLTAHLPAESEWSVLPLYKVTQRKLCPQLGCGPRSSQNIQHLIASQGWRKETVEKCWFWLGFHSIKWEK